MHGVAAKTATCIRTTLILLIWSVKYFYATSCVGS